MLRIAIVGCGKIADSHLEQIRRIPECKLVAACDHEILMARQCCDRFQIPSAFEDVAEMLKSCHPDVVHITTPPQSHYAIGMQCIENGCHIYVEKPFAIDSVQAEDLIAAAESRGLKVTVGHDLQFSHVARRMRELVRSGYLGGAPVHMESYYCYDLGNPIYAKALLANSGHWVRNLPGRLLHNIISHGIARIAEHLTTENPQVHAHGFVSPLLRSLGEEEIIDELRVTVSEDMQRTASFTFSSQMRPCLNMFRIYGPRNGLALDQEQETLLRLPGSRYKSYAEKFIPPILTARQLLANIKTNVRILLKRDFQAKAGMKCLIETFYQSITTADTPPPIPYREILLTTRIMDKIFNQLNEERCRSLAQRDIL